MKQIVSVLILLSSAILVFSGCASIVSKSAYPININSNPDGAEFTIKNRDGITVSTGKTPTILTLKAGAGYFKGETYTVEFNKEGYSSFTTKIKRNVDGWYIFGNILVGGLIGWLIVDPATGAMWTLEDLQVDLSPSGASATENKLHIVTIDDVPENLKEKLIRLN